MGNVFQKTAVGFMILMILYCTGFCLSGVVYKLIKFIMDTVTITHLFNISVVVVILIIAYVIGNFVLEDK